MQDAQQTVFLRKGKLLTSGEIIKNVEIILNYFKKQIIIYYLSI